MHQDAAGVNSDKREDRCKDLSAFYNMLRPFFADDETLEFLDQIIAEETHHIQELHRLIDRHVAEENVRSDQG